MRVKQKMRVSSLIVSILFLIGTAVVAEPTLPEGWRMPTKQEIADELRWREDNSNRYFSVRADFDGDGGTDVAHLLVNDYKNTIGLFVFLLKNNQYEEILLIELKDKRRINLLGIEKVSPGKYETACGKGYFECGPNEPENIILKRPAISFFKFDSAELYFYWDNSKRSFKKIQISD